MTTVPEPLSAGLIIMSCGFLRLRNACRSSLVKLSVAVTMSCLMLNGVCLCVKCRLGSRSVGGVHELFMKWVVFVRLSAVIVIIKIFF